MIERSSTSASGIRAVLDDNPMVGEPKIGARRFWTVAEIKRLREHYPSGGVEACMPHLPGRSASAIYNRAKAEGLRSENIKNHNFREKRWATDEHIDALIVRTYQSKPDKHAVKRLAQTVNRPRWWVSKRAMKLGLTVPRFKEPEWTAEEIEFICARAHMDPQATSRRMKKHGWHRSPTSIVVKLKRLGQPRGRDADPDHCTASHLARLFGFDAKTVLGWIAKGWLKAEKRGTARTERQGGDEWWIHRRNVRAFVIQNASMVDLRKVDRVWFIDMLANGGAS